mgnify:CR=1 FL=1
MNGVKPAPVRCPPMPSRAGKRIRSDHCTNRLHPYTQEELDQIIIGEIRKLATDEEYLKEIIREDAGPVLDESELLKDRLAEIDKQTDKLLNLYQIGVVEITQIEQRLADLKQEREALKENLEKSAPVVQLDIAKIQSYANAFQVALDSGDAEYTNSIIRLLIDKIVVLNEDIEIHWTFC